MKKSSNLMTIVAVTSVVLFRLAIGDATSMTQEETFSFKSEVELSEKKVNQKSLKEESENKNKEEKVKKEEASKSIENLNKVSYESKLISQMTPLEHQVQVQIDSGIGMNNAVGALLEAWDTELNKVYKLLMIELPKSEKAKIKSDERDWIALKEAAIESDINEFGGGSGAMLVATGTALDMTKERTLELARLYDGLHK